MCRFFNGLSLNNGGLVPNLTLQILQSQLRWRLAGLYLQLLDSPLSGFKPQRSLEVIMFTSEEPTRCGISCLGSRLLAGIVQLAEQLKSSKDNHNVSFSDAAKSAGYTNAKGDLSEVSLKKGTYSTFVKLHIEQGPILEKGISIGVVIAIAAPASIKVIFEGNGGHAGAALMPERNDAGLATAKLALAVEKHVLNLRSVDTVGTVGELLDYLRDPSGMTIAMFLESIAAKKDFVPLEVKAGSLVVIHGDLFHQSFENQSSKSRHAYSLHVVDTNGCKWAEDNSIIDARAVVLS
ncbi:Ureidoglycolate hydrolase [Capsicum chinense]|nr:Ureidoglycolate hydrolase [Capsicum chinense]